MTNLWTDIASADLIIVMGGNAAEAHPCGFKWVTRAKAERGARLIVVDPRFTRTASVADYYAPIRPGTDITFLLGLIKYCIDNNKVQWDYVKPYTNAAFVVKDGYAFSEGLFSGYDAATRRYDRSSWEYEMGPDGYAVVDPTLAHPRCVWNLLKQHVAAYTAEKVEQVCGTPKAKFLHIAGMVAATSAPNKTMTSMYALGWTQHSYGSQNIRTMAMLQLILGNIGLRGGGMNALRGHSNIQGLTDLGLMSELLPGYLAIPKESEPDFATYMKTRGFKPLRPGQISYWQNYKKFFVSFQKAMWGSAATVDNDYRYDWLPKLDRPMYDLLQAIELMVQGKMNGYICQGFNVLLSAPNRGKVTEGLSKLKFLVVMDPLDTETANFWQNHGEYNDVDPAKIATEVIQLPTTCFAEEDGSLTNSGRWLQWHWAGGDPPGEAKPDIWIMAQIYQRMKALYQKEGGTLPDPILNLDWQYKDPGSPTPEELAREINGRALEDVKDLKDPTKVVVQKGKQLPSFAFLRDDGSTMCGCWIYSGCWTEAGNMMARRDNEDVGKVGLYPKWAFSWPLNRRVLYNRASCDLSGKPWDPSRKIIEWNGKMWTGFDVPDTLPTASPETVMPFIMDGEGTARLWVRGLMADGPFPTHYEPPESPVTNIFAPKIRGNPAARVFPDDEKDFGDPKEFPIVGTSYRLTEQFHFWTKHNPENAKLQPEFFVELSEELAKEKGITNGGWVRVWSKRGSVKAVACVTKRIKPMNIEGKTVHVVGVPLHWGFIGAARKGFGPNSLTLFIGDANTQTPGSKTYMLNIEPTTPPAGAATV